MAFSYSCMAKHRSCALNYSFRKTETARHAINKIRYTANHRRCTASNRWKNTLHPRVPANTSHRGSYPTHLLTCELIICRSGVHVYNIGASWLERCFRCLFECWLPFLVTFPLHKSTCSVDEQATETIASWLPDRRSESVAPGPCISSTDLWDWGILGWIMAAEA